MRKVKVVVCMTNKDEYVHVIEVNGLSAEQVADAFTAGVSPQTRTIQVGPAVYVLDNINRIRCMDCEE